MADSGKSVNQIAKEAGMDRAHLTRAMRGKLGIGRKRGATLAPVLGVTPAWLLGLSEDSPPTPAHRKAEPRFRIVITKLALDLDALPEEDLRKAAALIRQMAREARRNSKPSTSEEIDTPHTTRRQPTKRRTAAGKE